MRMGATSSSSSTVAAMPRTSRSSAPEPGERRKTGERQRCTDRAHHALVRDGRADEARLRRAFRGRERRAARSRDGDDVRGERGVDLRASPIRGHLGPRRHGDPLRDRDGHGASRDADRRVRCLCGPADRRLHRGGRPPALTGAAVRPVVIVGAGPTGLVLALWLTRLGVRVRIVDKVAEPGTTSRALAVQTRTLELYRQIGLADTVVTAGRKMAAINLWTAGKQVAHVIFGAMGADLSPFPYALIFA